jgi:RNase H-like domain found in reverse transcriptase
MQDRHFIAYDSRQLKSHEHNYSTHDFELMTIIFCSEIMEALTVWRRCKIYIAHKSLKYIFI